MDLIVFWIAVMPISYFLVYSNAIDLRGRLHSSAHLEMGFIRFHLVFWSESLKLLFHDFCCVHCVWNKERMKRSRVEDIKKYATECGGQVEHVSLGTVTPEFCDDPKNHERIASEGHISPFRFWLNGFVGMLFSPIHPAFLIYAVPIALAIWGTRHLIGTL